MARWFPSWFAGLAAMLLLLPIPARAAADEASPKLALVVGEGAYPARPLATAANDAALVAQSLAQAGFDVTAARDLDAAAVRATMERFAAAVRDAGPNARVFLYFSGYGVQYDAHNYLVPVDGRLVHDDDVPKEAIDLDALVAPLVSAPAKVRVLAFDLAHAHPFATADEMPLAPGLGLIQAPPDTLVSFDAAPGAVAPEAALPYGVYARALAEMIATPGLALDDVFAKVRLRVAAETDGAQVPWDDGAVDRRSTLTSETAEEPDTTSDQASLTGLSPDVAFSTAILRDRLPGYADFLRAMADGPLAIRIRQLLALRREALIWRATAQSDDPRADWTYMRRYPLGPHRFDARRRLAALHAALEPPPRFETLAFADLPPPTAAELKLLDHPGAATRDLPAIPPPPAALVPPEDPAFYDALPMPAPAPQGLLPIVAPLPSDGRPAADPGPVAQRRGNGGTALSETGLEPPHLTLADESGPIAELAVSTAADGSRTILETDAKGAVLSRTTTVRVGDGLTTVQTGAHGGILLQMATRTDADGATTTSVSDGRGAILASWRRTAQGIVEARNAAPLASAPPASAAGTSAGPVPAGPARPVIAAPRPLAAPAPAAAAPAAPRQATPAAALPTLPVQAAAPPQGEPLAGPTPPSPAPQPHPSRQAAAPAAPAPGPAAPTPESVQPTAPVLPTVESSALAGAKASPPPSARAPLPPSRPPAAKGKPGAERTSEIKSKSKSNPAPRDKAAAKGKPARKPAKAKTAAPRPAARQAKPVARFKGHAASHPSRHGR